MTKSAMFKKAHEITKQVIQSGDNYRATFGIVLRDLYASAKTNSIIKKIESIEIEKGIVKCSLWQNKRIYVNHHWTVGGGKQRRSSSYCYIDIETMQVNTDIRNADIAYRAHIKEEIIAAVENIVAA